MGEKGLETGAASGPSSAVEMAPGSMGGGGESGSGGGGGGAGQPAPGDGGGLIDTVVGPAGGGGESDEGGLSDWMRDHLTG